MRPLITDSAGKFRFVKDHDHRTQSWPCLDQTNDEVPELVEIGSFSTEHSYGAPAFFKPTVSEVMSQMPSPLKRTGWAFSIEVAGDGCAPGCFTADGSKHLAEVTVYARLNPQVRARDLKRTIDRSITRARNVETPDHLADVGYDAWVLAKELQSVQAQLSHANAKLRRFENAINELRT